MRGAFCKLCARGPPNWGPHFTVAMLPLRSGRRRRLPLPLWPCSGRRANSEPASLPPAGHPHGRQGARAPGRKTPKEARTKVAAAAAAVSGSPPDSWCGTLGCRNPGLRPGLRQRSGQSTCRFLSSTSIILFSPPPPILVHSKRVHHLNYTLEQIRCRCH